MEDFIKRYEEITNRTFYSDLKEYEEYVFEDQQGHRYFLKKMEIEEAIRIFEEKSNNPPIFEFAMTEDFSFVSNWVSTHDFELLKKEVSRLRANYQKFIFEVFPIYKGIHTNYCLVDSDDFGTVLLPNPVNKWLISFTPKEEDDYTENIED